MNTYGQNLFLDLMELTQNNQAFSFKDHKSEDGGIYRVFHYSLPRYSDFKERGGMQCRGVMFKVDDNGSYLDLAALPMDKFFSYGENPDSNKIDVDKIKRVFIKEDGSLLSSYINNNGKFTLKSMKQPVYALNHIVDEVFNNDIDFKNEVTELTQEGFTINFEFTSPDNRVLQEYEKPELHVLNIRNNKTGKYVEIFDNTEFEEKYPAIIRNRVATVPVEEINSIFDNKNRYSDKKGFEGYVLQFEDGSLMKLKTEWYLSFSAVANMQDFSKYNEYLFKAVINETTDELRSLLHYKNNSENFFLEEKLADIDKMEEQVVELYQSTVNFIDSFMEEHKDKEQKEFAMAIQNSGRSDLMPVLMQQKNGREVDIKEFLIRQFSKKIKVAENKRKSAL